MYTSVGTHPDTTYTVTNLSKFSNNPGMAHWNAIKQVIRYLNGTKDWWLVYGGKPQELEGFVDADGNSNEDRFAITGYAFLIDGGAVSWSSKKQEIIALSMAEAEYMAATHMTKEALWLHTLISEIFRPYAKLISQAPITLNSDNQAAIALT